MKKIIQTIPPKQIVMIFVLISLWILVSALFLQFFLNMSPCELCFWQRYPYVVVLFGSVLAPLGFVRVALIGQSICFWIGAMIALFHSGIERKWWKGFSSCSTLDIKNLSIEELNLRLMQSHIVKCDEISWTFFGLSLTNYNLIISVILGIITIYFIRGYDVQSRRTPL